MEWLEHLRRVIWEEESGYKYYFKKIVLIIILFSISL